MAKKIIVKDADGNDVDITSVVEGMLTKAGGDPTEAMGTLVNDNYELRNKNRDLRTENDKLKKGTPEGSVMMSKDDVAEYESYKALGKPKEVGDKLTELGTVKTELGDLKTNTMVRTAAEAHRYKHTVLGDLVKAKGLTLEMGESEVDVKGEKKKVPTAFVVDEAKKTRVELNKVVDEQFGDYIPALVLPEGQGQPTGTPWVSQQASGGGKAGATNGNLAQRVINQTYGKREEPAKTN